MEEEGCRGDDEDGGEGEECLGDACRGELGSQEGGADPDEGAEDGRGQHTPHRLAVAEGVTQLGEAVFIEQHQGQEEAHQSDICPYGGGGERHAYAHGQWQHGVGEDRVARDASGIEGGVIMRQPHLAEHQAEALTDARHGGEEDAFLWQLEVDAVWMGVVVLREDRQGDAAQGDHHADDGDGAHLFAEEQPSRERCGRSRERHEELSEARSDVDVTLHQAVVSDDVAHQAREQQPHPGAAVGEARVGHAHHQPQRDAEKHERHRHADGVERQRAHAFGAHLRKQRGGGPRQGDAQRYQFTYKHFGGKNREKDV